MPFPGGLDRCTVPGVVKVTAISSDNQAYRALTWYGTSTGIYSAISYSLQFIWTLSILTVASPQNSSLAALLEGALQKAFQFA